MKSKREKREKDGIKDGKNVKKIKAGPLFSALIILLGAAVFLYPTISNMLAQVNHVKIIEEYDEDVGKKDEEEVAEQWKKAKEYNEHIGESVYSQDPFDKEKGYVLSKEYKNVLNVSKAMAYIEIPKIDVKLPIYHGSSTEVLEKGVGHLESSSLPIGSSTGHCILTGHRGLPSAQLFTALDEMKKGDKFYIHVLDKTLCYEVDKISVILPSELQNLTIEEGKDYVTLVTCTPYGVNTHRLLVRGERCAYTPEDAEQAAGSFNSHETLLLMILGAFTGLLIFFILLIIRKLREDERKRHAK